MNRPEHATTLVDVVRHWADVIPDHLAFTFLVDGDRHELPITFRDLDRDARALAARLQSAGMTGERALLICPPGKEYIDAFLGCLYAGVMPVPAYPPRRHDGEAKLSSIAADATPKVAFTTAKLRDDMCSRFAAAEHFRSVRWWDTDVAQEQADDWHDPGLTPESLAFLQYTSGSTADPKGVMVSHANVMHNEEMIARALGTQQDSVGVSWLPVYHDMGLIGNLLHAMYMGGHCVLLSPHAFLQKPVRWLNAITRYKGTSSGGPNFAYELCARKITPEQKSQLDLSSWTLAFTGAEPVRHETLHLFARTFEPCGFRFEAFYPCYGMAETTLFVSGGEKSAAPVVRPFDAKELEQHRAVAGGDDERARPLVGCGRAWMGQRIAIVDPESREPLSDGRIGEIWVSGDSIAKGYWGRADLTEETFGAQLEGAKGGPFLRTGDLGFVFSGELFVTGRLKDIIIIRGTNHYPQDIELTAETSHAVLRQAGCAAFAIDENGNEELVLVAEVDRAYRRSAEPEAVMESIRLAVTEQHQLKPHAVVLIKPGSIPKTSSGKIQRRRCRELYLSGGLSILAEWPATAAMAAPSVKTA